MKKRFPYLLLLISLVSVYTFSQQRSFKVVRTPQGKEITLYKGSYALVVGNGKYTGGWDELLEAVKDAEGVADVLGRNGFKVTLVKNADKRTFLSELSNFTYKYGQDKDNQLLFYYAGHGHTIPSASGEELGYLVMIDTPVQEKDPQGFDIKSVDMQAIITYAKKIKSKHVLFMFDCCFSGTLLNLRERVTPKAISDAVQYPVRQFITAGRADEPVPDRSIFKQIFLDLLEGRRDEPIKDGYLTGEELGLYLKNTVPEYYNFQHPQYGKIRDPNLDMGDFVFVLEKARPVETVGTKLLDIDLKDRARVSLLSYAQSFSWNEGLSMVKRKNFFDSSWNKSGGFENEYESKTINGDKVVLDHATGLMWYQSGSEVYMKYDKAKQWVEELNRGGYAGYSDWRLPTLEEGASLIEKSGVNDGLYIDPKFSAKQRWIWTSDMVTDYPGRVWVVDFNSGSVNGALVDSIDLSVRPVRSVQK